jgi:16S rRNA (cytidine1402-2'-O)-methyltransferase
MKKEFYNSKSMLYLVSTPIGNLEDITHRAVKILSLCDYILCEDTRNSKVLLDHLGIKKRLISYHKFNEKNKLEEILKDLESGLEIALISDGGTPLLCDPGNLLVNECFKRKIKYTAIPGACSVIDAFILSGMELPFQFVGFLSKGGELQKEIKKILCYDGVTICFESPKRLLTTIRLIKNLDRERDLFIARELTKKFEEIVHAKAFEMEEKLQEIRGEVVLLIAKKEMDFKDLGLEEMLDLLKKSGLSSMEALKMAAKLRKEPKRELYKKTKVKPC